MREPDREIDELASAVIGAAIEVHRVLGPGFLESVYEEALAVELELRGIEFERQKSVHLDYKGHSIGEGRLDLFVKDRLVVELKAVDTMAPIHTAQIMSYLKALDLPLGLLINFKVSLLKHGIKRVILSPNLGDLGALAVQSSRRDSNAKTPRNEETEKLGGSNRR